MTPPWLGIAAVLATLAAIILFTGCLGSKGMVKPETSRKLVHMALGIVVLFFPFMFSTAWPVWILAGLAALSLALLRWLRPEGAPERQALLGVSRESYGEFCFPLAVAMVFTLGHDHPAHYLLALATLAFADAAGALVGVSIGRVRLYTDEGTKTLEGSAAVFAVTLFLSSLIFLIADKAGASSAIMAGILVAGITTLVEAVAVKGFDNLFIPLLVWALAEKYMALNHADLGIRVILLILLLFAAVFTRPLTRLNHAATFGVVLGIYLCAALGTWRWTLLSTAAFGIYLKISRGNVEADSKSHPFAAVMAVFAPALFWLLHHVSNPDHGDYGAFSLALTVGIAMMVFAEWTEDTGPDLDAVKCIMVRAVLLGCFFGLGCSVGLWQSLSGLLIAMIVMAAACGVAVLLLYLGEWRYNRPHRHDRRWLLQGGLSFLLSFAGVLL